MRKIFNYIMYAGATLPLVLGLLMLGSNESGSERYLRKRAVKLTSSHGSCSGEQVRAPSGASYILTAAHCKGIADRDGSFYVIKEDGNAILRKLIAEDPKSDLLLLEGLPMLDGIKIADTNPVGNKVRTFTHGKGHATHLTEGETLESLKVKIGDGRQLQSKREEDECVKYPKHELEVIALFGIPFAKVCVLHVEATVTTAKVTPGSSGGMIVDSRGALVGVVSAGDGDFGLMVRLSDIKAFLAGY